MGGAPLPPGRTSGCEETLDPLTGTQSLRVELISPADPGSADERLDDAQRDVTLSITALDEDAEVDASFTGDVDIYVHYLGGLTPTLGDEPLDTVAPGGRDVRRGHGQPAAGVRPDLPVDRGQPRRRADLRHRHLADPVVPRPVPGRRVAAADEAALDALERSPLEHKQINVSGSRYGANGRLVVTGVYAQGYTLSDVDCADADGTPPCVDRRLRPRVRLQLQPAARRGRRGDCGRRRDRAVDRRDRRVQRPHRGELPAELHDAARASEEMVPEPVRAPAGVAGQTHRDGAGRGGAGRGRGRRAVPARRRLRDLRPVEAGTRRQLRRLRASSTSSPRDRSTTSTRRPTSAWRCRGWSAPCGRSTSAPSTSGSCIRARCSDIELP